MTVDANESAVLGAILLEPDRVIPLCRKRKLSQSDFSDPANGKLFSAMTGMFDDKPIGVLTVAQTTGRDIDALNAMVDACETWAHAEYYIEQIQINATSQRVIPRLKAVVDSGKPVAEILDEVAEIVEDEKSIICAAMDDPFPAIRLADLQKYVTPPDHIIAGAGLLRRGAGCLFTGGTGLGKTVAAQQIAVSVSTGTPIMGCIQVHAPCRVLYCGAENDEETLQRDILSIVKHADGHPCPVLVQANLCIHHVFGLAGNTFADWLGARADKIHPDLIVVDPYQSYLPSGTDINTTSSFLGFIQPVSNVIREHNCALLLVAHTPKPKDRESWTARESVYMAAGTSAISNWARTSMELTTADEDSGRYRLRFGKNAERNGLTNDNGGIVRDLYIEHSGNVKEPFWRVSDNQGEPSKSKYKDEIIMCAAKHPSMSQRVIADEVGCSVALVSKWYPRKAV